MFGDVSDALLSVKVPRKCQPRQLFLVKKGERLPPPAQPSDVDLVSDTQGVFKFDTEVAHCAIHRDMTKQDLDRAQIARFTINQRRLCAPQRMRADPLGSRPIADTQP